MSCEIRDIKTVSGLGLTPARVNRKTGTVFLNKEIWGTLNPETKDFILNHEKGHYCKQTKSEFEADKFAFNELAGKKEKSLKNIVKAISENLFINQIPEHRKRYENIVFNALLFDWINYNNYKAYQILKKMEAEQIKNLFINYLKSRDIVNIESLTDEEKELYLTDFMMTPEMQDITIAETKKQLGEDYSNFSIIGLFKKDKESGDKKPLFSPETKEKFKNAFGNIAGGLISKLGKGLGFNPNVSAISSAVNPVNNPVFSGTKKEVDNNSKPNAGTQPEDKKAKNKKMLIIGGIVVFVIGVGIALYFGLRNK